MPRSERQHWLTCRFWDTDSQLYVCLPQLYELSVPSVSRQVLTLHTSAGCNELLEMIPSALNVHQRCGRLW